MRIVRNTKIYIDKTDISEQFNQYFINIGPQLASTIPQNSENLMQFIIKKTPSYSFMLCLQSQKLMWAVYSPGCTEGIIRYSK